MTKYILATLVILGAWLLWFFSLGDDNFIGQAMTLSYWVPVGITVGIIGIFVALFVARKIKARRAAKEIERVLAEQAKAQVSAATAEQRAEIDAMQREFKRAVKSLRSSKLGKSGFGAMYSLPWYVIIGPPGAGKTTALRSSGLHFPGWTGDKGGLKGVGGTRNCDWWFTNEAIILDTAGRYVDSDGDSEEWLAFLDMLRSTRSRKPVDGVIVAIGLDELAGFDRVEIVEEARRVRERVDELMSRLDMVVPVYLMFTKCDLVEGFTEVFGALKKTERQQIWGFTLPLANPGESAPEPEEAFRQYFDELTEDLSVFCHDQLWRERRTEAREAIYGFPQQFRSLRDSLGVFVDGLFSETIYQESPMMRGVYFTSGTQEGRPIDRVMKSMADAFGVPAAVREHVARKDAKSYFLHDVFADVIFADDRLAVRSASERRRQRRNHYLTVASVLGGAGLIAYLTTEAYLENADYLERGEKALEGIRAFALDREDSEQAMELSDLEALRGVVERDKDFWDRLTSYGLYQVDSIKPEADDLYASVIRSDVVLPIMLRDVREMRGVVDEYLDLHNRSLGNDEFYEQHDRLKNYLLLTGDLKIEEKASDAEKAEKEENERADEEEREARKEERAVRSEEGKSSQGQGEASEDEVGQGGKKGEKGKGASGAVEGKRVGIVGEGSLPALTDRDWVARYIEREWGERTLLSNELRRESMREHVTVFLDLLGKDASLYLGRDPALTEGMRAILTRVPEIDFAIEQLTMACRRSGIRDLSGRSVMGSMEYVSVKSSDADGLRSREDARVRGVYTRNGWELVVRDALANASGLRGEDWVLGRSVEQRDRRADLFAERLKSKYFENYIAEWKSFLRAIAVDEPTDNMGVLALLRDLTRGGNPPYRRLFNSVAYNARLNYPVIETEDEKESPLDLNVAKEIVQQRIRNATAKSSTGRDLTRLAETSKLGLPGGDSGDERKPGQILAEDVKKQFAGFVTFGAPVDPPPTEEGKEAVPPPVELDIYQEQLAFVRDTLQSYLDDPSAKDELLGRLQEARTRTRALIEAQQPPWRPRFEALLWPPINAAALSLSAHMAGGTGLRWCNDVVLPHDETLLHRYPFDKNAQRDASLDDFATFFAPKEGTLWGFYSEALVGIVQRIGAAFHFGRRLGQEYDANYEPRVLSFLAAARVLTDSMFPGIPVPTIKFKLQIQPSEDIEEIRLMLGEEEFLHQNAPEQWHSFTWSPETAPQAAILEYTSRRGRGEISGSGDWSLFRLLDKGRVATVSKSGEITVVWVPRDQRGYEISLKIRPERALNPFVVPGQRSGRVQLFKPFRDPRLDPPRQLARGQGICKESTTQARPKRKKK